PGNVAAPWCAARAPRGRAKSRRYDYKSRPLLRARSNLRASLIENLRTGQTLFIQHLLRIGDRPIDILDRVTRYLAVSWIQRPQTKAAQPCERIEVVADTSRFGDVGERAACKNAVRGKQQPTSGFNDRNAPRSMAGRVKHAKAVIAQVDARHIFEPEVNT